MADATAGPSTFDEVRRLFDALWGLRASEWERQLEGRSTRVREQVLGLLEADRVASQVLATRGGRAGLELLAADLAADADPEQLGSYRILRRFGTGAMGVVYEAEQHHPRRTVALKVLHPWLRSAGAVELFRFEAQALGQVAHPGIPVVYEAGEQDGVAYLSMEPVHGVDLATWHRRERPRTERVLEMMARIADAVHAAHEAGLLHRDLKPSNVLVAPGDTAKLLDFGVAAPLRAREPGLQPGTPVYMSPEQARGEPLDRRSDVHALGTMAFELLTGRPPVSDRSLSEVLLSKQQPAPLASSEDPSLDPDLDHVLARALALRPDERCPDAASLARDLRAVAALEALPWRGGGIGYRTSRFVLRHRRSLGWAGGGVLAMGLVAAGGAGAQALDVRRLDARVQQRVARVDALLAAAPSAGEARRDALAAVDAFVADPEHQGHPATYQVWLSAAELHPEGSRERVEALAAAYRAAVDDTGIARVQVALGEAFHATADWDALEQLEGSLLPEARGPLRDVLVTARLARRDIGGALALDEGRFAWASFLGEATDLGTHPRALWLDVLGDGRPELLLDDATSVSGPLGAPAYGGLSGPSGTAGLGSYTRRQDHVLDAVHVDGETLVRRFAPDTGSGPWSMEVVARLDGHGVQDTDAVRTSSGWQWLVASSYPMRDAFLVDDEGTVRPFAGRAVGADVRAAAARDLDGDGVDEVLLALGSWSGYGVRLYRDGGHGYEQVAETVLGTVGHIDWVEGPDGPLLVAAKVDDEADPRFFGPDDPFGPAPGLYVLDPQDDLAVVKHVPIPLPDDLESTPARGIGGLRIGDVDGDGRLDVVATLQFLDLNANRVLWLVHDVLGEAESAWVAGMEVLGIGDIDDDGADELLIRDDQFQLFAVGVGAEHLPRWVPDRSRRLTMPTPPPGLDPLRIRDWERARELANLGLNLPAVAALDQLAARLSSDEASSAHRGAAALVHRVTGDLLDRSARPAEAAPRHERALGLGDPSARQAAMRSHGEAVEWARAGALAATGEAPTELGFLEAHPGIDLLSPEVLAAWRLALPGLLRHAPDGLHLDAFNDMGVLVEVPVEVTRSAVSLVVEMAIDEAELGSGLSFELYDPATGEVSLGSRVWGQGGGGYVKIRRHCFGPEERQLGHRRFTPGEVLVARVGRFPDGRLRCGYASRTGAPRWVDHAMPPVTPGAYLFRIRAAGDPSYAPPSRMQARLQRLELTGAQVRAVAADEASLARHRLAEGDLHGARGAHALDQAWVEVARGAPASVRRRLAELLDAGETARVGWLLRVHPQDVVPPLEDLLAEDFATVFRDAMDIDVRGRRPTAAQRDALLLPSLQALPASDPAGRQVRLWRARIRMERGERARAAMLAQSIVAAADAAGDERAEAYLLLAQLAETEAGRAAHVARALEAAVDPALARRVAREGATGPGEPQSRPRP